MNYIANKPSDTLVAGADLSYSRFNTVDLSGYVSGPISDTLTYRIAARAQRSDDWQYSYTHPDTAGSKNLVMGRAALEWKPTESFTALLTLSGFRDQSETQMPQLYGISVLSPTATLDPRIGTAPFGQFGHNTGTHYPFAPKDARAADWSACANVSPFDEPFQSTPIGAVKPTTATNCDFPHNDNKLYSASLRLDYDIAPDLTVTSLTAYHDFKRFSLIEGDGTIYQDYESLQQGSIKTFYQELRLSGKWWGEGNWVVGGNYEQDKSNDHFLQTYGGSTANPTLLPGSVLCGGPAACTAAGFNVTGVPLFYANYLGPTEPINVQTTDTYAGFAHVEYPILENLTFTGGIRYTKTDKHYSGCGLDGGDGSWAKVSQNIQNLLELLNGSTTLQQYLQPGNPGGNGINVGPGGCGTTGPGPTFNPLNFEQQFDENNISWQAGLNWQVLPDTLLYVTVAQGWKAGAFPTVASSAGSQLSPAKQEGLLAYEIGVKSRVLDELQINAAVFYYDYSDKQLQGAVVDPVFGPLPKLINVPKSHVLGFEVQGRWEPIEGLVFTPSVSYSFTKVDGCSGEVGVGAVGCHEGGFFNFDAFHQLSNLTGENFPDSPKWQADIDGQYEWQVMDNGLQAFLGFNLSYQSDTNNGFFSRLPYDPAHSNTVVADPGFNVLPQDVLHIRSYYTLDLRAGVENDTWRFQIWGKNVTDQYYWTSANHVNDVLYRYAAPPATYGFTLSYKFQ